MSSPAFVTYAVGDIHGRADLLQAAIDQIGAHAKGKDHRLVFLGDYVDRGPDSRTVINMLINLQRFRPMICLKGNHEDLMLGALADMEGPTMAHWLRAGGEATLTSYGIDLERPTWPKVPAHHIRWLAGLPLTTADEHRIYVHAGLEPGVSFPMQDEQTFMWIRERFLRAPQAELPTHIVHGHTPFWAGKTIPSEPELLPHRSNLDTQAYASGVLTVGVFDSRSPGGPVELIPVRGAPGVQSEFGDEPAGAAGRRRIARRVR